MMKQHDNNKPKKVSPKREMRFMFQCSGADSDVWDWLNRQPHRGAYLKALILADKERRIQNGEEPPAEIRRTLFDLKWESQYELLQGFLAENGRLPLSVESYHGVNVGRWLNEQKRKKDALVPARRAMLENIGALDDKWEQIYRLVLDFQKEFGRLPKKKESYRGLSIGAWLALQIKQNASLDAGRAQKLKSLGALQTQWERNFETLQDFVIHHGRLPKYLDRYENMQIGRWLNYQCKTLDPSRFPAKANKLICLGAKLKKGDSQMNEKPLHIKPPAKKPLERCVLCHRETDIPSDTPIDKRQGYIIGCGQLCKECFEKTK